MRQALKKQKDGHHWELLVGYTLRDLREHLGNQFKEGMSWGNYGRNGWHIDHKIPISLWGLRGHDDPRLKQCWALDNLQPLWAIENQRKGNRI
jgi:5-methylcytosine-specific restriction endonuclease McrA